MAYRGGNKMKEVNGKIWIENVSRDVKDISQLDLKTYRIPARLMEVGGILEIGPGISPKNEDDGVEQGYEDISKYVNGIYCTNLTMEQVMEQVHLVFNEDKPYKPTIKEEEPKEPEKLDMQEPETTAKSNVDSIYASIYRIGEDYRTGKSHLLMGVPVGASLEHLVDDYKKNVVPKFATLSSEEKEELLEKLQNLLDNGTLHIERSVVTNAIDSINALLSLSQEGSKPIKK